MIDYRSQSCCHFQGTGQFTCCIKSSYECQLLEIIIIWFYHNIDWCLVIQTSWVSDGVADWAGAYTTYALCIQRVEFSGSWRVFEECVTPWNVTSCCIRSTHRSPPHSAIHHTPGTLRSMNGTPRSCRVSRLEAFPRHAQVVVRAVCRDDDCPCSILGLTGHLTSSYSLKPDLCCIGLVESALQTRK